MTQFFCSLLPYVGHAEFGWSGLRGPFDGTFVPYNLSPLRRVFSRSRCKLPMDSHLSPLRSIRSSFPFIPKALVTIIRGGASLAIPRSVSVFLASFSHQLAFPLVERNISPKRREFKYSRILLLLYTRTHTQSWQSSFPFPVSDSIG